MFLRLTLLLHSDVPSVFVILGVPRHARAGLGDLVRIIGVERERERESSGRGSNRARSLPVLWKNIPCSAMRMISKSLLWIRLKGNRPEPVNQQFSCSSPVTFSTLLHTSDRPRRKYVDKM